MTSGISHRRKLADLVAGGSLRNRWVHEAFQGVPRGVFVPRFYRFEDGRDVVVDGANPEQHDEWLRGVYADEVLTVQLTSAADQTDGAPIPTSSSSMPTVMAGMLDALDLRPGHRVLEIGTGTGYNAALLCHRVGADNVVTVELDPQLADVARDALAGIGLHPAVHAGDGMAGVAAAAPFDRIIATAAVDHIPPSWIDQLAADGVIVADLRGSLDGSLVRLTRIGDGVVQGAFLDLPGAFMPMRTRLGSPHRDGEKWDHVLDRRNPQHGITTVDPGLLVDDRSLRFLAQLQLSGRRLRGFLRSLDKTELFGHGTDGSWCTVDLRPDDNGHYPIAQGGPQRLWHTVESSYTTWRQLETPTIDQFGVTAYDDAALQYVWFGNPDSEHRWPLPL